MNNCDGMVILPLTKYHAYVFVISLCICDSIAQWLCVLFQPSIQSLSVYLYLALLKLYLRDPSLERKTSFFLKVVFAITLEFTFHNLGYILSANKLAPLPGSESAYLPWENDKV